MKISVVQNSESSLACYKLRFTVFSKEEGDFRYAKNEEFKDAIDALQSTLVKCIVDDMVIGTARVYPIEILSEEMVRNYKLNELPANGSTTTGTYVIDRVCVSKEFRKKGVYSKMNKFIESSLPKNSVVINAISVKKTGWINKYILMGYTRYSESTYKGWTGVNCFKTV